VYRTSKRWTQREGKEEDQINSWSVNCNHWKRGNMKLNVQQSAINNIWMQTIRRSADGTLRGENYIDIQAKK
jgi:hypothetical protein